MPATHWSDEIVGVFDKLHSQLGVALIDFSSPPAAQSQAEAELEDDDLNEHLRSAYSQASILIEVAADHLSAFVRAITQPALSVSPWTSIRGLLEASAISRWLLEPNLQPRLRACRSLQFRCEGLTQRVKFVRVAAQDDSLTAAVRRLEQVLQDANSHGLELKGGAQGTPKSLLNPMPPVTDLVRDHLDQEAAYRLLSAMAHAHPWALQQLAFAAASDHQPNLLEKALDIEAIAFMGQLGLKSLEMPIVDKCKLFGWPSEGISGPFADATREFSLIVREVSQRSSRPA